MVAGFIVPIFISCTPLYPLLHTGEHRSALYVVYHIISFVFDEMPCSTAGKGAFSLGAATRSNPLYRLVNAALFPSSRAGSFRSHSYGFTSFNASAAIGNIAVRFIFKSHDAPHYYSVPFPF
ncbi:BQ5605_C030g10789 [Microbotryum silenes-dioicae]|uniref:BQ5605_C030g10789 protein n=1 Tax=Microbotryum silenes-dioicae TaxID=796604 RepID=A0A2X0MI33_9BASI|nr:BQ5605_C030g10789 [Microbotryum silenes-dioicae]